MLKLIVRANARRDKAPLLLDVREEVEQLKVVLRLSQDVKAFSSFGAVNSGWVGATNAGSFSVAASGILTELDACLCV